MVSKVLYSIISEQFNYNLQQMFPFTYSVPPFAYHSDYYIVEKTSKKMKSFLVWKVTGL